MNKALIDLDIVVYTVGSACDNWYYEYAGQEYESKKDLMLYLTDSSSDDVERDIKASYAERKRKPESWDSTKDSVIKYVEDILKGYPSYEGWLSGNSNFRYQAATILPYKGNRDSVSKPTHYDTIRQFLVDSYDAKISVGMEADDAIGLAHTPGETLIVTVDKDLDCIPGDHFNWQKDIKYTVSEVDANRHFFKQVLTGDPTDNILGLYGIGEKSAYVKRLKALEDTSDMNELVLKEYIARFGPRYGPQFLKETAALVWILQKRECPLEV